MLTLALDTSSAVVSVAVHDGADVVATSDHHAANRHGELLAPAIESVLTEVGASPRELRRIAVGVGPGPFTGLRVGLMTARALGHALGIEVVGVVSLDAVAGQLPGRDVTVVTDARRREVYAAAYDAFGQRIGEPFVATAGDVAAGLRKTGFSGVVAGVGVGLYPEAFDGFDVRDDVAISAAEIARLASAGRTTPTTEPLYLRRPDATAPGPRKPVLT